MQADAGRIGLEDGDVETAFPRTGRERQDALEDGEPARPEPDDADMQRRDRAPGTGNAYHLSVSRKKSGTATVRPRSRARSNTRLPSARSRMPRPNGEKTSGRERSRVI